MSLWVCAGCTCRYSVGAPGCPHCGSTEHEEEQGMPKTHADGTVTDATTPPPDAEPAEHEGTAPGPERPAPSASKAAWVRYAVALGHDQAYVDGLTKADLTMLGEARHG